MLAAWARGGLQAPRPHGSPGASPSSGWGTRCPLPRRECEPRAPARPSAPRPPDKYPPFRQQRAAQPSQCLLVDRNLPMKRTRNTERASGPRAPSGPRPQLSLWPPAPSAALPPRPSRQQPRRFSGRRFGWSGFIINAERCAAWPFASTALECGPAGRRAQRLPGHLRPRCGRGGPGRRRLWRGPCRPRPRVFAVAGGSSRRAGPVLAVSASGLFSEFLQGLEVLLH